MDLRQSPPAAAAASLMVDVVIVLSNMPSINSACNLCSKLGAHRSCCGLGVLLIYYYCIVPSINQHFTSDVHNVRSFVVLCQAGSPLKKTSALVFVLIPSIKQRSPDLNWGLIALLIRLHLVRVMS